MLLGALIDAGVPLDEVRRALGSLAIDAGTVWTERVVRTGISATKFCVRGEDEPAAVAHAPSHAQHHVHDHPHGHDHDNNHDHAHAHDRAHQHGHDTHAHRTLPDIYGLIDGSLLTPSGKDR